MTETFDPPKAPGFPAKKTTNYRVRKWEGGEGAVQVAQDGKNSVWVVYELTWPTLTLDEADEIETFMNARGGFEAFYYTVPGDVERLYRGGSVVRANDYSGVVASVSVTLMEVFVP